MEIQQLDIKLCENSPLLAHVPLEVEVIANLAGDRKHREKLGHLEGQWAAWAADVATRGVDDPGKFYREAGKYFFVDGRNRLHAARLAGHSTFPGLEVEKTQAFTIALASLAHRKGSSKGAQAYLALTLHPYLIGQGSGRKKEKPGEWAFRSLSELAAAVGVGASLMDQAAETHRYFADFPDQRAKMEPRVLAGVIGVGACRAGAGGGAATAGQEITSDLSLTEVKKTLATFTTQMSRPMGGPMRAMVVEEHRNLLRACPLVKEIWLAALEAGPSPDPTKDETPT